MWTSRPDSEPCCGPDPGPVADSEEVVRLLHSRIETPAKSAFTRGELHPPEDETVDNSCGNAHGVSVLRRKDLSDAEVQKLSEAQAAMKTGRQPAGGRTASVRALRSSMNGNVLCFLHFFE